MFRRSILILSMCCSCATGFVQMHVAMVSPAKMLSLPSRSAAELLPAYARTALMPEITAAANAAEFQSSKSSQTWYIRPDGGTRYSARATTGQCNGLADTAYSGTGTNQPCAFNDVRFLWDDQSYGNDAWVIAGGDTVIIRGCAANANQPGSSSPNCRIGWDNNTGRGAGLTWCFGSNSNEGCFNPPIPSGTPGAHTKIYGQCVLTSTCNTGNVTNLGNLTQLFGGFATETVLDLSNTSYVDIEGLELTNHNGLCSTTGSPAYPAPCSNSGSTTNDFAYRGLSTNNATSNILLQDVNIHGFSSSGIQGPIGGPITMNRVAVNFNAFAGWNFDDGNSTPDAAGSSITASYVLMEGNGCNEEYPIVHAFPAVSCYDLSSGGFGDSWSGQQTELDSFTCNHCQMIYNTKDGFIGPHTDIKTLIITDSESIGNMGQQWKWTNTPNSSTVFENNLTVGNCNRMSAQLPGAVQNFNSDTNLPGSYLSLFCRAAGDVFSFSSNANSTVLLANNTVVAYSNTVFDMSCVVNNACGTTPYVYTNNIILGYGVPTNNFPGANGQAPGLFYYSDATDAVVSSNNIEYGVRNGDTNAVNFYVDPSLVGEPAQGSVPPENTLDNFNFSLASGSPAIGAGVPVLGLLTDYNGVTRPATPAIGALELGSVASSASAAPVVAPPATVPPPATQPVVTPPASTPPATTQPVTTPSVTWVKIATEGNTVTIPAGLTVRFGAPQGTPPGDTAVTAPLPADSFDPPVTFTVTTTFVISNAAFGGIDPAPNYVKELDLALTLTPIN